MEILYDGFTDIPKAVVPNLGSPHSLRGYRACMMKRTILDACCFYGTAGKKVFLRAILWLK